MSKIGAFDYGFYKQGMDGRNDARLGAGLIAIKAELVFNGFDDKIVLNPVFGEAAANRLGAKPAERSKTALPG